MAKLPLLFLGAMTGIIDTFDRLSPTAETSALTDLPSAHPRCTRAASPAVRRFAMRRFAKHRLTMCRFAMRHVDCCSTLLHPHINAVRQMAQRGILGTVAKRQYAVRPEVSQTRKGKWPKMNPTTGEPCCLCTSKLLAMVPGRLEEDKGQPDEKAIGEVLPITHGTSKLLAMVPGHLEKATRQSNQKAIGKPLPITHGPVRVRRPTLSAHWTAQRKSRRRVRGWRIALKTIIIVPFQMVPNSIRQHELTPDRSPRSHWGVHGSRDTAWLSLARRGPRWRTRITDDYLGTTCQRKQNKYARTAGAMGNGNRHNSMEDPCPLPNRAACDDIACMPHFQL